MRSMDEAVFEYCKVAAELRQLEKRLAELRKALETLPAGTYTARRGGVTAVLTVVESEREVVKTSLIPREVLIAHGAIERKVVKTLKGELVK